MFKEGLAFNPSPACNQIQSRVEHRLNELRVSDWGHCNPFLSFFVEFARLFWCQILSLVIPGEQTSHSKACGVGMQCIDCLEIATGMQSFVEGEAE